MRSISTAAALSALTYCLHVRANTYDVVSNLGGPVASASYRNQTLYEYFVDANHSPNATRSIQFAPFFNGGLGSGNNAPDTSNLWTWRVNVTDVAAPDAAPAFPGEQPGYDDAHVTNTVFDFSWPGGGNLSSALNGSTAAMCISVLMGDLLPNVTNLYTDDDADSVDCTPALGEACVTAMRQAVRSTGGKCEGPANGWAQLPECAGSFGASVSYNQYGIGSGTANINGNYSDTNSTQMSDSNQYGGIYSGSPSGFGFFSLSTEAYNATNLTSYYQATTKLQVMLLEIMPPVQGLVPIRPLCMRVNTTQTTDDSPSASSSAPSSSSSTGAAAPAAVANIGGAAAGLIGLSALVNML